MAVKENTYEKQATLSLVCGGVAGLAVLGFLAIMLPRFHPTEFEVMVGQGSKAYYALFASAGVAVLMGAAGFFLGLNSAGQKRNKKNRLSWAGFFLNAGLITLAMSALLFFWFTKEVVPLK
jgi:hypothetical protein